MSYTAGEHDVPSTTTNTTTNHLTSHTDPALNISNEHKHAHLHHDAFSEKNRDDGVMYTKGTTSDPSIIPQPSPLDHGVHHTNGAEKNPIDVGDAEKASATAETLEEPDPRKKMFARFYARYRIVFRTRPLPFFPFCRCSSRDDLRVSCCRPL
jgi:hypothetical protein